MIPKLASIKTLVGDYMAPSYDVTFKVSTGFTTDANGNRVPSGTTDVVIPCRLKRANLNQTGVFTQTFPGTDAHQILLNGWVNSTDDPPIFPAVLRKQRTPIGAVTIDGIPGKIECRLSAVSQGAENVGERFLARFTPD